MLTFSSFVAILLLLVISGVAESQASSLRQGAGGKNLGSFGLTKPETNAGKQQPSSQETTPTVRKSDDFGLITSNRRLPALSWVQVATFPELDFSANGGYSVSMSGDGTFLAAAPQYNSNNFKLENGIVRFYKKQSGGSWMEMSSIRLFGGAWFDFFGSDVSLSNDGKRVAIGAWGDNSSNGANSGSVSVYEMDTNGAWSLMGVIDGEAPKDRSGWSVSTSKDGSRVAIG
eukprot:scaffold1836_cov97-Cylindrotheca_fusiformis.AAC.1